MIVAFAPPIGVSKGGVTVSNEGGGGFLPPIDKPERRGEEPGDFPQKYEQTRAGVNIFATITIIAGAIAIICNTGFKKSTVSTIQEIRYGIAQIIPGVR